MWSAHHGALFWVDIFGCAVNMWRVEHDETFRFDVGERVGWIIERSKQRGFLLGMKSGVASMHLEPFEVSHLFSPEEERPFNRLNDAKLDREGHLWMGSKDDTDREASGALYRVNRDLTWARCDDGYTVTNGPTFSLDGRVMYHADTGRRLVYAFDLSRDGELSNRREFVRFEDSWGYPDGMTTDRRGGIWIAHWDGAKVTRFHPDGRQDYSIPIPTRHVTSLTFGGLELDRLFVTTAAFGQERDPLAGSLFEIFTNECGVCQGTFGG